MTCLEDNALFDLASGRMSLAQVEAAEAHLDGCQRCRKALAMVLRSAGAPAVRPPPLVSAGTAIGRYLVIERVGAGAMGQVFSAYDPQLDRKIAIKLLRPGSATPEQQARLAREAQTLARMSHPNVVTVFDVGTWEGQLFVALEFVASGSAREWMKQPRTWREIVRLYAQAGRGLAAAHDAGVVHRDFKPDNVLVRPDGRAQVTDFGLSAGSDRPGVGEAAEITLTHSGVLLGTPAYMAPDQLEGTPATPASDQYSFCAALFEALYAARPFTGADVAELARNARGGKLASAPAGNATPQPVRRLLLRGLSADPRARHASMTALVDALESETSRSRRLGAAVAVICVAGALVAIGLQSTSAVRRHPACVLAEQRQSETWSQARQSKAREAFAATQLPYATNAWGIVERAIAPRVSAWSKLRSEACEAVVGEAADPFFRGQLLCLDERWAEVDATIGVLELGGVESVNRAQQIVDRLPAIGVCAQPSMLQRYGGSDAGTCETCVRDTAEVARVRALVESGRLAQAEQASRADAGLTTSAARASMQLEHGRALGELGRIDEAEQDYFEAALGALRGGDTALGAAAYAELAHLVGYLRSKPAEGEKWAAQAEALHSDPLLAERLASVRGVMAARRGEHAKAEASFAITEQLVRERLGPAHPSRGRAMSNLASSQMRQGQLEQALPKLAEAAAIVAKGLGEEHPDTMRALNSWGAALGVAERFSEAAVVFDKVLTGYKKTLGPDNQRLGVAMLNLAEAHFRLGDYEKALGHFTDAAQVWERALGPDAPDLAAAVGGVGQVLIAQKEPAKALVPLQRAIAICEKAECEPVDEATVRFLFARASVDAKLPRAPAEAQAQKALTLFKAIGEGEKKHAAEVEGWLKAK
jgi:tetratricopeptide (TPR) repeat protein